MRVGLITSEFPPDLGGVETYAWQLAGELGRRNDLEVTVYAPPASAGIVMPDRVALKPILTSCAGLDWPKLQNQPIDVWHALSAAHSWIALRGRPTVVSVHGNDFLAPYPLTARPPVSLPILWRWRSWSWRAFEPRWKSETRRMLGRALPRCRTIIANSRYTAEALAREWPECASRSKVSWVGVDPKFFDVARAPRVRSADTPHRGAPFRAAKERRSGIARACNAQGPLCLPVRGCGRRNREAQSGAIGDRAGSR